MEGYEDLVTEMKAYFNGRDIRNMFCHGGCFYFAKKVVERVDGATLMWNHQLMHCAVLIDQGLYDITGRISKKGFMEVDAKSMRYMEKHFIPGFDVKELDSYLQSKEWKKVS